jgi:hypothetical protein
VQLFFIRSIRPHYRSALLSMLLNPDEVPFINSHIFNFSIYFPLSPEEIFLNTRIQLSLKSTIFWDKHSVVRWVSTDVSEKHIASIFRVEKISWARNQRESMWQTYAQWTTTRYILEDGTFHYHRREYLKSTVFVLVLSFSFIGNISLPWNKIHLFLNFIGIFDKFPYDFLVVIYPIRNFVVKLFLIKWVWV